MYQITELERRALIETMTTALVEAEESEDISQGVIDELHDGIKILGGKYES